MGGCIVIALTKLVGTGDYNGAGMDVIERAVAGEASGLAWVLKLLFTAVTIGLGFKGGEVVPSFFVGATFGCVAGSLLGLPPGFAAAVGLVAVFCGAVNCPIASVILSIELFGSGGLLYFAMACAVSSSALWLLRALQQPDHPLLQAARGVYQRPREVMRADFAKMRVFPLAFLRRIGYNDAIIPNI